MNTKDYQDMEEGKEGDERKDVGQVEYEMPLLPPSKDKRLMTVDRETKEVVEEEKPEETYLHIKLKKR